MNPLLGFTLLVSVSLSLQQSSTAVESVDPGKGYECADNFYFRLPGTSNFEDAKAKCMENGATLLNIRDSKRAFVCGLALTELPGKKRRWYKSRVWLVGHYDDCYFGQYAPYCMNSGGIHCNTQLPVICKRKIDSEWLGNGAQCPEPNNYWTK